MPVYLGLDCGGSSSRALALDDAGNLLHQGQGGSANLVSTPERRLRTNLQRAIEHCPDADYICGCFAGLMTNDDRERAKGYLQSLFPGAKVHAEPDYAAAYSASETGTDICVIAGTGSLVCSRHEGRMVKSGGRGYLLGDQGSAFQFGRDALLQYLNHRDEASESLRDLVFRVFDERDENAVVSRLYLSGSAAATLAKLAKAVPLDARDGLEYAVQSVNRNMGELAAVVRDHTQKNFAGRESITISLAGGLWHTSPMFRETFLDRLSALLPGVEVNLHRITRPPVYGAVLLAKEMACVN